MADESPARDVSSAPTEAAASPAEAGEDWCGREVAGRYRVMDRLGEGGMGVVYLAEHLNLKKKVALKVIHPELAANEDLLLRFKREALATGQLDHPHIAAAIDFEVLSDKAAFMVMPFVRGQSLTEELAKGVPLDWRRLCRLGAQIADALSAAHSVGIVHRDLKPDNVLLEQRTDGTESAKVLDFGVASLTGRAERISADASRPLTQAGTILGTPGYMSPEQATAGDVDHRTDLYALGVILWELASGKRLFDGNDPTEIFAKQFKAVPSPLSLGQLGPAGEFSALVAQLLSWEKGQRPESAGEVRNQLRALAERPAGTISSHIPRVDLSKLDPRKLDRAYLFPAAGVLVVFVIGLLTLGGSDAPPTKQALAPDPPVSAETEEEPAPAAPKPTLGKTIIDKARKLVTGMPPEVADARETVLHNTSRTDRKKAAKLLRAWDGDYELPQYLKLVADMEVARGCRRRKKVLEKLRELGDSEVLPVLQRMADAPRGGCGFLRMQDCNRCLRRELKRTIEELE